MGDEYDPHILPFAQRTKRGGGEPPEGSDADNPELVAPGDAYATARGTRSPLALRFVLPAGKSFAMPYAYHPIVWADSPGLLLLEYPRFFTIILAGKNLGLLDARLAERRVTWIRQCDEQTADRLPVAVTRIERMHRYPSRELNDPESDK